MAKKPALVIPDQPSVVTTVPVSTIPRIAAVHPFGSKILVDVLRPDEAMGTSLYMSEDTKVDGAPQAYIVELGPDIKPEMGLAVGQRIYWGGTGTPVNDPRCANRVRALLEVHNVKAIIEEAE